MDHLSRRFSEGEMRNWLRIMVLRSELATSHLYHLSKRRLRGENLIGQPSTSKYLTIFSRPLLELEFL